MTVIPFLPGRVFTILVLLLPLSLFGRSLDEPQERKRPPELPKDVAELGFSEGLRDAEAFRKRILVPGPNGRSTADLIADAIAKFPEAADPALTNRPNLRAFRLTREDVLNRIKGQKGRIDGPAVFGPFAGQWHGLWESMRVDHDWGQVLVYETPLKLDGPTPDPLLLRCVQYAWVGDGFGWNVVATTKDPNPGDVILGTVSHVIDGDVRRVRLRRPHVGLDVGPSRLIWITGGEVFFEEMQPGDSKSPSRYAITGFRYRIEMGRLMTVGDAFQAIYTRDPEKRPPWFHFPINLDNKEQE